MDVVGGGGRRGNEFNPYSPQGFTRWPLPICSDMFLLSILFTLQGHLSQGIKNLAGSQYYLISSVGFFL